MALPGHNELTHWGLETKIVFLRAKIPYWIKKFLPTWQPCEYVVTSRCTESAAQTISLWISAVDTALYCIPKDSQLQITNIHYIGNLILQKWHKITKIVGGIEMKFSIPFQFRSIPSCNSNSTASSSNSNSGIGTGIAINSNSGIDPNPGFDSYDRPSNFIQIGFKSSIFQRVWTSNLMDDHAKQQGTFSMLCQALCIISKPVMNSDWSYSPETLNSGQNQQIFLSRVNLKFDGWPWKSIGHLFYAASSFVYRFIAISHFKLELQ